MPLTGWPQGPGQIVTLTLGTLAAAGNTDVAIVWPSPFPDANYAVTALLEMGTASIGSVMPVLKWASRTTTGCTITLVNTAVAAISSGAMLHVTGQSS